MSEQPEYTTSKEVAECLQQAQILAVSLRHEYIMPEHVLKILLRRHEFKDLLLEFDSNLEDIENELDEFLNSLEKCPKKLITQLTSRHNSA